MENISDNKINNYNQRVVINNVLVGIVVVAVAVLSYFILSSNIKSTLYVHKRFLELFYNMDFTFVPGVGYTEIGGNFIITESCSGAKLFVSAFLIASLGFGIRIRDKKEKIVFLIKAYIFTLLGALIISIFRIIISLPVLTMENAQLAHNIISLICYFGSLACLYLVLQVHFEKRETENNYEKH